MTDTDTITQRPERGVRVGRRRRRSLKRRAIAGGAALALVIVMAAVGLSRLGEDAAPATLSLGGPAEGGQVTYLLVGARADDPSEDADWLTLLAADPKGKDPLTVLLPTSTLAEIPGYGFESLGKALALGRMGLQEISVANVLGIQIDHALLVDDDFIGRLVDGAGGVDVTIREKLQALDANGNLAPVFQPGRQHLDAAGALKYLAFRGHGEDELARLVRQQQLWEALYARYASRTGALAAIITDMGNQLVTDARPAEVGALFAAFAAAGPDARLYRTLPVEAVSSAGPEDAYRVVQAQLDDLVVRLLAASRPPDAPGRGARVQVLNGNGRPEVGLSVADLLVPAGFRIADTGNASSFDFAQTKIVVYRDADLPIAERIRSLLGLGVIEISRTQQTIVDVTIVVGRDFAPPQN